MSQESPSNGSAQAKLEMARKCLEFGFAELALSNVDAVLEQHLHDWRPYYIKGRALARLLRNQEAAQAFLTALTLPIPDTRVKSSILYALNLLPGLSPKVLAEAHLWVMKEVFPAADDCQLVRPRTFSRPLRLGFISSDFHEHPISYFLEPLLQNIDRAEFSVSCFQCGTEMDFVTQRLQQASDCWIDCSKLSASELLPAVREQRVDILVDLSGHTVGNRLSLFAERVAPLQLSWLGYPCTTGLGSMDYRVVDRVTAPTGEDMLGSEQALRLPGVFACFRPSTARPAVQKRSSARVFGSLHRPEKLNEHVLRTWAQLLNGVPDSVLLIAHSGIDTIQQKEILAHMRRLGVANERVSVRRVDLAQDNFLDLYNEIDVFLDVFPWSGHTLSCHAISMGTPVVTLRGQAHAGRMVASVLTALGRAEWIAENLDEYVAIAANLISSKSLLADLAVQLPREMAASSLCDERRFADDFAAALVHCVRWSRVSQAVGSG